MEGSSTDFNVADGPRGSDVEPEVDDVAVPDHIVLALGAELPGLLGPLLALAGDEVLVGDHLGADEAPLEVGVDDPGGLGRLGTCGMVQARTSLGPAVK